MESVSILPSRAFRAYKSTRIRLLNWRPKESYLHCVSLKVVEIEIQRAYLFRESDDISQYNTRFEATFYIST